MFNLSYSLGVFLIKAITYPISGLVLDMLSSIASFYCI